MTAEIWHSPPTHPRRARRFCLALAVPLVAAFGCGDDDPAAPKQVATARLRVVQAVPDAPNVDVLVDNTSVLTGIPFKTVSDYLNVRAGVPRLRVRAVSTYLMDRDLTLTAERAYTVLLTGRVTSIVPLTVDDDVTNSAGSVKLRLVHASTNLPNVDVYVTAPTVDLATESPTLSNLPYSEVSDFLEVPAGTYRVRITVAGGKLAAIDVNNVALAAGQVRTVVLVDAPGGGTPGDAILLAHEN